MDSLPTELILIIVAHLDKVRDVLSFGATCQRFASIVANSTRWGRTHLDSLVFLIEHQSLSFLLPEFFSGATGKTRLIKYCDTDVLAMYDNWSYSQKMPPYDLGLRRCNDSASGSHMNFTFGKFTSCRLTIPEHVNSLLLTFTKNVDFSGGTRHIEGNVQFVHYRGRLVPFFPHNTFVNVFNNNHDFTRLIAKIGRSNSINDVLQSCAGLFESLTIDNGGIKVLLRPMTFSRQCSCYYVTTRLDASSTLKLSLGWVDNATIQKRSSTSSSPLHYFTYEKPKYEEQREQQPARKIKRSSLMMTTTTTTKTDYKCVKKCCRKSKQNIYNLTKITLHLLY